MELAAILQVINILAPQVRSVVTIIRNANGTHSVVFYLDAADVQLTENITGLTEWLKAHGASPTP